MENTFFFHVDMDAFFASVEQLDHPEYRGKPVIVGGLPGQRRSVVSTASYEARKFGVHSAMPVARAVKLCPNGIFLPGRMKRYHEKSEEVMSILSDFSPDIQQISIDEAFLDMSGTQRLWGSYENAAGKLKSEILEKTGLTVSVGAAAVKYIAKIASGMKKPAGLYCVERGSEQAFMLGLPLSKIWGIGSKTLERLNQAGFRTSKDVYNASKELLATIFGQAAGNFLYNAVRGIETDTFNGEAKSKSVSAEHTFPFDLTDDYAIETQLMLLAEEVMFRLLRENWQSKTVCVKIRYEDFTTVSIQETFERNISTADDFFLRARILFAKKYESGRGIRLLGLGAHNLEKNDSPEQAELFDFGDRKKQAVEKAILGIRKKNPDVKIRKARFFIKLFAAAVLPFLQFIGVPAVF
ncbi:MAG: DNA polymerase IV [Bacteroides sp.]|nr:DNA polymerase IV [Prevotella sp.]MCM1408520.1 DNA polymerase IV [Treponema brennaborense]MCM1469319.1 DNA polymerase IV [Bacteroides sp.]